MDGRAEAQPEPLTTIISAAQTALSEFLERRVDGDMFSLINYANGNIWSNVLLLTSDFEYALDLLELSSEEALPHVDTTLADDYENLVKNVSGREKAVRMGFLTTGLLNHTNTWSALKLAMNQLQLQAKTDLPSADMILLFSDGMANCANLSCSTPPCVPICSDDYQTHRDALGELRNLALEFGNIGVPIHTVMSGKNTPHTRIVYDQSDMSEEAEAQGAATTCLSQEQVRANIDWLSLFGDTDKLSPRGFYTLGGDASGSNDAFYLQASYENDALPYFEASFQMELLSIYSDGKYFALRKPATTCPDNCESLSPDAECDMSCPAQGDPRLTVDPYCRGKEAQVSELIESLLGEIPYAIVESS
jgi:hypothetical protein